MYKNQTEKPYTPVVQQTHYLLHMTVIKNVLKALHLELYQQ